MIWGRHVKVNWGFIDGARVHMENGGGPKDGVGQDKASDGSWPMVRHVKHGHVNRAH